MEKEKVLKFHNTPNFYCAYMENWVAQKKKEGGNPAELAIVEDLTQLVKVAVSMLQPAEGEKCS